MQKYAVLISYVGTRYCGWQKQKGSAAGGAISVQEVFEQTLQKITGEEVSVVGSGRTDAGVHAVGQCVHFILKKKLWDPEIIRRGMNSKNQLPTDIRVRSVKVVEMNFHAQRSATHKQYSYYFQQGPCALPQMERYSWWIQKPLDLEAMRRGLDFLKGEHDFKPFQAAGSKPGLSSVRKILEAEISCSGIPFPGGDLGDFQLIRLRLVGTGFLKQMVRGIAGTLLEIGENRRPAGDIKLILESLDRKLVGPTAPGRALWLEQVWYDAL
jgi:tRNA pseudouridine38-40 synthase